MSFYDNINCPVCNKEFEHGDDIVTCPHCGTPHHRECYNSLGHCANYEKHNSGYSFRRELSKAADDESAHAKISSPESQTNNTPNADSMQGTKCVECGEEIPMGTPFCTKCGARQPDSNLKGGTLPVQNIILPEQKMYEYGDEYIDGERMADVAAVVRTNTKYFLPKFKKDSKIGWNWAAFLFGPYYFLFRKMYKQGFFLMVLRTAINTVVTFLYSQQLSVFIKKYEDIYNVLMSSGGEPAQEQVNAFYNSFSAIVQPVLPVFIIFICTTLIIAVACAVLSNHMYRGRVLEVLKGVESKLKQGGVFERNAGFGTGIELTQADYKKIYLARTGGTSIYIPVFAAFIFMLVQQML